MRALFHHLLSLTLALQLALAPAVEAGARIGADSLLGLTPPEDPDPSDTSEPSDWRIDMAKYGVTAELPTGAGYDYLQEVAARPDTTLEPIVLLDYSHFEKTTQISPAAMALLSIAIGQFVGPWLSNIGLVTQATTPFMAGFLNASVSSVITQSIAGVVSGEFDIGNILQGAVFAGLGGGLSSAFNLGELVGASGDSLLGIPLRPGETFAILSPGAIVNGLGNSLINSSLSVIQNGGSFGDAFLGSFGSFLMGQALAATQFGVGEMNLGEGSFSHATLHGLVGCLFAEVSGGDCAAGFMSGVASSLYAGTLEGQELEELQEQNRAQLLGAFVGFVFSGGEAANVSLAAAVAQSAIANNRQLHRAEVQWLRENAAAFAREQCEQGNCITEEEALRQLTLQAGRNVDRLLASGIEHNPAAQAFLDTYAPQGLIAGTEGDPAYIDSNQTWFSATVDQYNNPLINYAHIADNADVYGVFADVQSALGGNIDVFQITLLISNSEDLAALSPTQKVELIRAYYTAWQGRMAMLDPGLHDSYALMVGEMGQAAIRQAIHTMTDADWDSLPPAEQEYLTNLLVESYLNTLFTVPGGDGAPVRPELEISGISSAKLRNNVLARIEVKVSTNFGPKILRQMEGRGWDKDSIEKTIEKPHRTVNTRDTRHNPETGGQNDDPATAYINEDGSYVVRNDRTGDIVQISDRTDPEWKPPFE